MTTVWQDFLILIGWNSRPLGLEEKLPEPEKVEPSKVEQKPPEQAPREEPAPSEPPKEYPLYSPPSRTKGVLPI